jgi:hypothetical protein
VGEVISYWKAGFYNEKFRWMSAYDSNDHELFSVCQRGEKSPDWHKGGDEPPFTRWCVFHDDQVAGYCDDIPIDLDDESVKAMAITLWRMRDTE